MKSKLEVICEDLKKSGADYYFLAPVSKGSWDQLIYICVAPKDGLYTAKELQHFMKSLFSIRETSRDDFHKMKDGIFLGSLFFDEKVKGKKRRIVVKIFPNFSSAEGVLKREIVDSFAIMSERNINKWKAIERGKKIKAPTTAIRKR